VPLGLLAWLGQRSIAQDHIVAEHQSAELAASRLREAQTLVHSFIYEMEQSAVTALSFLQIDGNAVSGNDINAIRDAVMADPFLEQVFVLNTERQLLFPQDRKGYSNRERQFAEAMISVLNDNDTFKAKPASENTDVSEEEYGLRKRDNNIFSSFDRRAKISKAISNKDTADSQGTMQTGWTTFRLLVIAVNCSSTVGHCQ